MDIFLIFFDMKVCCVFSLESPHRGNPNDYTQYTIINTEKKITLNYSKYYNVSSYGIFFLGTQEQVRNRLGKRVISVRVTEVLLYLLFNVYMCVSSLSQNTSVKSVCLANSAKYIIGLRK